MQKLEQFPMKSINLHLLTLLFLSVFLSCSRTNKQNQGPESQASHDIALNTTDGMTLKTEDWVPLFNGKDLKGWEVKGVKEDQHHNFWSVQEGAIRVNSLGIPNHNHNWLMTKKEYADFELKLKFQSYRESPGNSGIQIRSRYDDNGKVKGSNLVGWLDGPQIDINPSDPWRTGFIYDETRGHQRWIYPDLPDWNIDNSTFVPESFQHYYADEPPYWNDLVIVCKGNHITTIVNNIVIADYDGTGVLDDVWHQKYKVDKSGFIALQLHTNDELKLAFKDIFIKEL